MALKYVIDELVAVPGPQREFYKPTADGKFALDITDHPDAARVKSFREHNIELTKQQVELKEKLAAFGDLDPVAAKAALAKLAAGDADDVVALKLELATEKGKSAAAIADAAALARRHAVSAAFLAAGGQPEAVDLIVMKAPADADADKLTEWLADAAVSKELGFAFRASKGGGSGGSKPARLGASAANELRDPSPQQLGQHATEIASGKLKVVYSNP